MCDNAMKRCPAQKRKKKVEVDVECYSLLLPSNGVRLMCGVRLIIN